MRKKMTLLIVLGVLVATLVVIAGLILHSRGLRMALAHRVRALLSHQNTTSGGNFTNVIFLHHSTGRNLICQGGVRERLTEVGFQFWDHDYNYEELTRPDGMRAGYSYGIPGDNTDPDGFAQLFAQRVYRLPLNAFSGLMQHEVIAFKSCFPASRITSDEQLEEYKAYYLRIQEVMDQHRDRIFVVVTPPPLNPAATDAGIAARARAFANWLKSDDFLAGRPNVFTFDFFDLLAEGDSSAAGFNMLRVSYCDGKDSHPNELANQTIGPVFADFIVEAARTYRVRLAEEGEKP